MDPLPPTPEQRLAQLEKEMAFLKSQGLSRAEQEGLLNSSQGGKRSSSQKGLVVWLVLLSACVTFMLVDKFALDSKNDSKATRDFPHAAEPNLKRDVPFSLPSSQK
jgi:hypothetical protein